MRYIYLMYKRFSDHTGKRRLVSQAKDFHLRGHGLPPRHVVAGFMMVLLAAITLSAYLVYLLVTLPYPILLSMRFPTWNVVASLIGVVLILGAAALYSSVMIYKIRSILRDTEFQTLLFASGLRVDTEFCLLMRCDDQVTVYHDAAFSNLFPSFQDDTLAFNALVHHPNWKPQNKKKLKESVAQRRAAKIPLDLRYPNGRDYTVEVRIQPLQRPAGYIAIRGFKKAAA